MIARTVLRVLLSLVLFCGLGMWLAPAVAADRRLAFSAALILVAVGGLWSGLRLFARGWVEAYNVRAQPFWGYAAPPWAQDLCGILFIFAGAGLLAWGMA